MGLTVFVFTQSFSKVEERSSRTALTRDIIVLWRLLSKASPQISA